MSAGRGCIKGKSQVHSIGESLQLQDRIKSISKEYRRGSKEEGKGQSQHH
jgi:hypothetical protein